MKQVPLYIHAAVAASPQHSFQVESPLSPLLSSGNGKLYALDADYSRYIAPVAIRRMSRIMKMTISAAMECLAQAGVTRPGAIITGTGRGGVADMEQVVKDLRRFDEGSLNPTAFIQSTYNSPNGWIAMQSGCTCYNQTYVHRGCSLELALQDAQMTLAEGGEGQQLLVGCYDELTEEYYLIRRKRGYWKANPGDSLQLLQQADTPGTIAGEGAAFFVLSGMPAGSLARLDALEILHDPDADSLADLVDAMLADNGMQRTDLSCMMLGVNGDNRTEHLYDQILGRTPEFVGAVAFKPLCGEFETAIGFGLWLAVQTLQGMDLASLPAIGSRNISSRNIKNVMLVNHFQHGMASCMLLSRPQQCR